MDKQRLDRLVTGVVGTGHVAGAVMHLCSGDDRLDLVSSAGNIADDSAYCIASINKLFMSALILRLASDGRLTLEDRFADFVSDEVISGLHVLGGTDYSREITVTHLLSQRSGLPDYFEGKQAGGRSPRQDLEAGLDPAWPLERVLEAVKTMTPHFPPGQPGRARYIDTNHQLLQLVVQELTGRSTRRVLDDLFRELGMSDTYVAGDPDGERYVPVRYKARELHIDTFLSSTGNDIISTARDLMLFLKAFFAGRFWPQDRLRELEKWTRVFFPFEYGIGIQRFAMPAALAMFRRVAPMIGHAGSVSSIAFYVPEKDVYITGTANQQAKPSAIYPVAIRAVRAIDEEARPRKP